MINLNLAVNTALGHRNATLKDPDSFLASPGNYYVNKSGIFVDAKKAQRIVDAYRAVTVISNDLGSIPKKLFRKDGSKREEVSNSPQTELITRRPNHYMNPAEFHELIGWRLGFWGNFIAEIKRDRLMQPQELIPLKPTRVHIEKTSNGVVYYDNEQGKAIPDFNIIHVKEKSNDGIVGLSPIKLHAQSLGINLAIEQFEASFYGQGTIPGGVLTLPEGTDLGDTDDEAQEYISQLRQNFEGTYAGPDNFNKILIIEPGMEYTPFTMPFKDAKFLSTSRSSNSKSVGKIWGVPLFKLFEEEPKYDNIEAMNIDYVQTGLMPRTIKIEEEYNRKLLSERQKRTGHYFKFNLAGLMRADLKTRYEAYALALGSNSPAWFTPEEVRIFEERNPEPEDGRLWAPKNMAPQDAADFEAQEDNSNALTNGVTQNGKA